MAPGGGGRGFFITFEGAEGAGKSTQCRMLSDALGAMGHGTVLTAEPGGTDIGRKIRALLLDVSHGGMDHLTELLLYAAARRQHLAELILPALNCGSIVVCDRFSDSTMAYQGFGRGIDRAIINELDQLVTGGLRPDLTILLDIDVSEGLRRNRGANKVDRLELEDIRFHERVRQGFLRISRDEPQRVALVSAAGDIGQVHSAIMDVALQRLHIGR